MNNTWRSGILPAAIRLQVIRTQDRAGQNHWCGSWEVVASRVRWELKGSTRETYVQVEEVLSQLGVLHVGTLQALPSVSEGVRTHTLTSILKSYMHNGEIVARETCERRGVVIDDRTASGPIIMCSKFALIITPVPDGCLIDVYAIITGERIGLKLEELDDLVEELGLPSLIKGYRILT